MFKRYSGGIMRILGPARKNILLVVATFAGIVVLGFIIGLARISEGIMDLLGVLLILLLILLLRLLQKL